jgi:hypothetical protein
MSVTCVEELTSAVIPIARGCLLETLGVILLISLTSVLISAEALGISLMQTE